MRHGPVDGGPRSNTKSLLSMGWGKSLKTSSSAGNGPKAPTHKTPAQKPCPGLSELDDSRRLAVVEGVFILLQERCSRKSFLACRRRKRRMSCRSRDTVTSGGRTINNSRFFPRTLRRPCRTALLIDLFPAYLVKRFANPELFGMRLRNLRHCPKTADL